MEGDATAGEWAYESLDLTIDATHRSHLVTGLSRHGEAPIKLASLRLRMPMEGWRIDPRWIPRCVNRVMFHSAPTASSSVALTFPIICTQVEGLWTTPPR